MQTSNHPLRRSILCTALALGAAGLAPLAQAQQYPTKSITMVVPYPPGGSNDSFARQIAKELGDALKQTVIVENRPGASGNTGTGQVAKAAADGYTLVAVSSSMTTNAAIQPRLPFDPVKSLAPVAMLARGPMIVAINKDFPARTPAELISAVKANPDKFNYATSGTGSVNHFATEMLRAMAPGFDITHVPYKGQGPAMIDLTSGVFDGMFDGMSSYPQVQRGSVTAVAIAAPKRHPDAPELPTFKELGMDFVAGSWFGLLAPAGVPDDIVAKINADMRQALSDPEVKAQIAKTGMQVTTSTPEAFGKFLAQETQKLRNLIRQGAKIDIN